jgi:prepilin-type N-terminal cleavage/methylation domain-containing protein
LNIPRGITLIELLVALVIVAVLAAAAVLAMPDFASRRGEVAAERVAALLAMACERAMVTGRDMGVVIDVDRVGFGSFTQGVFTPLPDDAAEPLRTRRLPAGFSLDLWLDGRVIDLNEPPRARIACQANGELTPFELLLERDGSSRWRITGAPSGRIERERVDAQ